MGEHAGSRPRQLPHAGGDPEPAAEGATQPAAEPTEPTRTTQHAALTTTTLAATAKLSAPAQPAAAISATRGRCSPSPARSPPLTPQHYSRAVSHDESRTLRSAIFRAI